MKTQQIKYWNLNWDSAAVIRFPDRFEQTGKYTAIVCAHPISSYKAVTCVVPANYGRLVREGDMSPNSAIRTLEAISVQRTAEARGADPIITTYIPNSVEYYRTPRGQAPGSPNKLLFTSIASAAIWDAFHNTELLLTQPLQIVVGGKPGSFGSYRDGFELFNRARSEIKDLYVANNASHYQLYDQPEAVKAAMAKIGPFFQKHLAVP